MKLQASILVLIAALLVVPATVTADHVIVRVQGGQIPGTGVVVGQEILVPLEGTVSDTQQAIMTVTHEKFRKPQLHLAYGDTRGQSQGVYIKEVIPVPSRKQQFQKKLSSAQKGSTDERLELAIWAIKNGMVPEFYRSVELVLESDRNHAQAKQILALRDKLAEPIPESAEEEKRFDELKLGGGMKIKRSAHYILAYDTPDNRADDRLDLLERVYETFFIYFALKGRVLDKPSERLTVIFFNDHKDYLDFSVRMSPELKSAAGYVVPEKNVAVFFVQGTYEPLKRLNEAAQELEKEKKEAERKNQRNRADLVRLTDTFGLIIKVLQESHDVEVVTHEATHHIAGNNGLFPRHIRIPSWAQEGLAAFFESPNDATWSGVGAINQRRIDYYRVLEKDRVHSDIDFIVSDQIYSRAANLNSIEHAYGQAWALTHFLMERHFDKLNTYWANLARLPADMVISENDLNKCFHSAFGKDTEALDVEWRRYMNELKTDTDKLKKEYGKELRALR